VSENDEIIKVEVLFDEKQKAQQDEYVTEKSRIKLIKYRKRMWAIFIIISIFGVIISILLNDNTQFARSGSLSVVIGLIFARIRFNFIEEATRSSEAAMMDPRITFLDRLQDLFGDDFQRGNDMKKGSIFSREDVNDRVYHLKTKIDSEFFKHEFIILSMATLIWGYGDILMNLFKS